MHALRNPYLITEKVKSVSFRVQVYNCATLNAILSKTARTMWALLVDGRNPINPEAA